MYEGHPVVCVTPAGRRRYMRLLAPLVLASPLVDRWDLWVNTGCAADLAFLQGLARLDPRVRLVQHPTGAPPGVEALGAFSRLAADPGTINCICWFGEDMALAGGVRGTDEEEELSAELPTRLRRTCCFDTDVAVAHFAFYTQREVLDASEVLAGYASVLAKRPELAPWLERTHELALEADRVVGGTPWGMGPIPVPLRRRLRSLRRRLLGREPAPVTVEAGPCF